MSTETTNKKIKIDNGTTFGRTYTDKAVDELLKGVGGSDVVTINCTNEQAESFINNRQITFTEEQFNIIKNINYSYLALYLPSSVVNQTFIFSTYQSHSQTSDTDATMYTLFSLGNNNTIIGNYLDQNNNKTFTFIMPSISAESIINTITFEDSNNQLLLKYSGTTEYGYNSFQEIKHIVSINNNPVIGGTYMNYSFTEDKTISLFGKHSILVPKNSADTAIDLYIHNIVLKDNAETTTKKIYLTAQSTTNTPATTKELLQTLLGSTSRYIRVSGYTSTNDISAINWTGTFDTSKYDVRGTETLLTDFTVIEDSVVTL